MAGSTYMEARSDVPQFLQGRRGPARLPPIPARAAGQARFTFADQARSCARARSSSTRAIERRCTSSGPSASRRLRTMAHIAASGVSPETPAPPKGLDRAVEYIAGSPRRGDLDRGDLAGSPLEPGPVDQPCGLEHEQACLFEGQPRLSDPLPDDTLPGQ